MKFLSSLLTEAPTKKVVVVFGRFNPPTKGHELLLDTAASVANRTGSELKIYTSQSQDAKKNPLSYDDKIKFLKLAFPKYKASIIKDTSIRTPFEMIGKLANDEHYDELTLVVGSDRAADFKKQVGQYVNHKDLEKRINLKKFNVVSAGDRDPDDEGVAGLSASKLRQFASEGDYRKFFSGVPSGLSDRFGKELYTAVRKGMSLKEEAINGLGFDRSELPQIREADIDEFLAQLEDDGVNVLLLKVPVAQLRPTQDIVDDLKVQKKQEDFLGSENSLKPFLASNDFRIIDGHHAWKALNNIDGNIRVDVHVIDLDLNQLIDRASQFNKAEFRECVANHT